MNECTAVHKTWKGTSSTCALCETRPLNPKKHPLRLVPLMYPVIAVSPTTVQLMFCAVESCSGLPSRSSVALQGSLLEVCVSSHCFTTNCASPRMEKQRQCPTSSGVDYSQESGHVQLQTQSVMHSTIRAFSIESNK
jgi:hypothetical protein